MNTYFIYNKETHHVDMVIYVDEAGEYGFNPFDYCEPNQGWLGSTSFGADVYCDEETVTEYVEDPLLTMKEGEDF